MAVKFGLNQVNNPAPLLYRRVVNALIIFVIPATATLISQMPEEIITDVTKNVIGMCVTWLVSLLKGAEYFLGESTNESGEK